MGADECAKTKVIRQGQNYPCLFCPLHIVVQSCGQKIMFTAIYTSFSGIHKSFDIITKSSI